MMNKTKNLQAGLAVAFAFFASMLSSSLPTPLYKIYRELFGFSASGIMVIFGVYAAGVLTTLLITSRLNIPARRYRTAIYIGIALIILSSLLMIFAKSLVVLALARFITGVGSGVLMVYVNRTLLILFSSEKGNLAASMSSMALIIGQTLGPAISGNALYFKFYALTAPFILLIIISLISSCLIWFYFNNDPGSKKTHGVNNPKSIKNGIRELTINQVRIAYAAIFLSWGMASTLMSQGPSIALNYYGVISEQQISFSLSAFLGIAGLSQILLRKYHYVAVLKTGILVQAIAIAMLIISIWNINSSFLLCIILTEGFAYGAILVGAASVVNAYAVQTRKLGTVNKLYIIGYTGNWLPLLLSLLMDSISLHTSLIIYFSTCLFLAIPPAFKKLFTLCK